MRGPILILVIGSWSFAQCFKLDALESSKINGSDNLNLHHLEDESVSADMNEGLIADDSKSQSALIPPTPRSNLVFDEKVRSLTKGRAVAFGFKDDIDPIIVDSPPPGINFTNCVVDDTNGYCCIDFVGEIRAAVTNPVLECVTKEEKICHTTYVTEYEPMQDQICEENYEKKCTIVTVDVDVDETVKTCMKPLQRVCNDGPSETVHRIKRDTLSTHLKSITDLLDETLENPRRISAGSARSLIQRQLQVKHSDQECRIYFETICTNKDNVDIFDKNCERIPVRLCAEGCIIKEGKLTCKTTVNKATSRRVPEEKCEIVPQTVCKTVTKLVPHLFPKEYCQTNPKELCQLKFTPNLNLPSIQPIIQRYCLAGRVLEYTTEEDIKLIQNVKDQLEIDEYGSGEEEDFKESKNDTIIDSVHEPRKLDDTPSDFNQFENIQDKEDIKETLQLSDGNKEKLAEEINEAELTTIQPLVATTLSNALKTSTTEGFTETITEEQIIIESTLAPFTSIEQDDTLSTNADNIETTGTYGITFFSEETTTEIPLMVSTEEIEVNEPTETSENMTTEPTINQEMDTKNIVIGENEPEQETTITPEIRTTKTNMEGTTVNESFEEQSDDKTLSKQYRNIVPIKVGYLPALAGKGRSNDVLSGYDKYINKVIKKQQKPSYGVLKPIKSISPKPSSTTISTISPSFETTIIDGFTIPKTKTTIKSKSYADIKPKALIPKTDGNLPNDINTITETVKKIIAEKISAEHQPVAAAQKQIASSQTTIIATEDTTTMSSKSTSTEIITSTSEVTDRPKKDTMDKTTMEQTQSEIKSSTTDNDITTATSTEEIVTVLSNESEKEEKTTTEQTRIKQGQILEEPLTTISTTNTEESALMSTEDPMVTLNTSVGVKSSEKSQVDNLSTTIDEMEEDITTETIANNDIERTTTTTNDLVTFPTKVDQEFSTSEDSTSEQFTTMQPSLDFVTDSEIKQNGIEIGETTTENVSPKFLASEETTSQISADKPTEKSSSATTTEQSSTQEPTTIQPLTTISSKTTHSSTSTQQPTTLQPLTTISSKTTQSSTSTQSIITEEASTTKPSTQSIITTEASTSTTKPSISTTESSIITTEPSTSTTESSIITAEPSTLTTESTTTITQSTTTIKSAITENEIDVDSKSKLEKSPRKADERKPKRSKFNIIRPIATFHIKPQPNQNAIKNIPELLLKHLNRKSEGQLRRKGGLLELLYN